MRLNKKTMYFTIALCLIISLTITSFVFADTINQNNNTSVSPVPSSSPGATQTPAPTVTPSTAQPSVNSSASPQPKPTPTVKATTTPGVTIVPTVSPTPKPADSESLWYLKQIPMKKAQQKLLWDYCKKRKLDYIDMLSLIYLESNFNEKSSNGKFKGYFQISSGNTANIAKALKIANKPLDGAININMGTQLYSWILQDKRVTKLKPEKRRDAALSIYQRGAGGYDRHGLSTSFLKKFYKKRSIICSYFNKK